MQKVSLKISGTRVSATLSEVVEVGGNIWANDIYLENEFDVPAHNML